jgi:hypothetical protein
MSHTKIISLMAILAVGAGLVYVIGFRSIDKSGNQESTKGQQISDETVDISDIRAEEPIPVPSEKKIPFAQFIGQGGSYKCTVQQYVENFESKGTTYVHNGMVRGEFTTAVDGMNMDSQMILRDGYTYSWSSMMPTMGFKISVQPPENVDTGAPATNSYAFNAEQIGDYDCEVWTPDMSKFEVPTNITFKSI